jgi:hypothetical protein
MCDIGCSSFVNADLLSCWDRAMNRLIASF